MTKVVWRQNPHLRKVQLVNKAPNPFIFYSNMIWTELVLGCLFFTDELSLTVKNWEKTTPFSILLYCYLGRIETVMSFSWADFTIVCSVYATGFTEKNIRELLNSVVVSFFHRKNCEYHDRFISFLQTVSIFPNSVVLSLVFRIFFSQLIQDH